MDGLLSPKAANQNSVGIQHLDDRGVNKLMSAIGNHAGRCSTIRSLTNLHAKPYTYGREEYYEAAERCIPA